MSTPAPARRAGRPKGSGAGPTHTARLLLRVTPEQLARYTAAAEDCGAPLSEWVREACEAFASDDPDVHPIARKHGFR